MRTIEIANGTIERDTIVSMLEMFGYKATSEQFKTGTDNYFIASDASPAMAKRIKGALKAIRDDAYITGFDRGYETARKRFENLANSV